jgi:drug/metabolite transporter (DMT)-like permease
MEWIALALFPLFCCFVGTQRKGARRLDVWLIALCLLGAGLGLALAVGSHDSNVETNQYVSGIVVGIIGGAIPPLAYYALGRALRAHPVWLTVTLVGSAVPLFYYVLFLALWVVGLAHCPPDAYECPL